MPVQCHRERGLVKTGYNTVARRQGAPLTLMASIFYAKSPAKLLSWREIELFLRWGQEDDASMGAWITISVPLPGSEVISRLHPIRFRRS